MKTEKELKLAMKAAVIAAVIIIIAVAGYLMTAGGSTAAKRIFVLLGGDFLGGGYIQFGTYLAFFWALFEIFEYRKFIKKERRIYREKILPTKETHVLLSKDVMDILIKASELEKKKKSSMLAVLIKKACMKFRTSNSIPEMIEIISIQSEINKERSESDQSNIRYLTWVIPSIGFIGTVLGISGALSIASSGDMEVITATLGVAFDTTLISLILSIIVMKFLHTLQEETDLFHAEMKEFVIENLVNRIEASV